LGKIADTHISASPGNGGSVRIRAGRISQPHGIKGFVKLTLFTDTPSLLEQAPVHTDERSDKSLTVRLKNPAGKHWIAQVDGISDRNAAEALAGTDLWIEKSLLPDLPDDEFYHEELIGLTVLDAAGGHKIGTVIAIDNFGAGDLLEIRPETGAPFYLPFTRENVPSVDIKGGSIAVAIPDGLL